MLSSKKHGFNRYEPPSPSLADDAYEDEYFLKELCKTDDVLPQPFRRVDKVLSELFEIAWEEIEKREYERIHKESAKVNLQKVIYEEELLVKEHINCFTVTASYLFLGSLNRISVYRLPELETICVHDWVESDASDTSLKDVQIISHCNDIVLLSALDEKGLLKILAFKSDGFFVVEIINVEDDDAMTQAEKVYVSEDATFLAVTLHDYTKEWLDVYKIPKDVWLSQLISKEKDPDDEAEGVNEEDDTPIIEFQKSIHLFQLSPPEIKPSVASFPALMKTFDAESTFIGTGVHHCMSSSFLQHLSDEFKSKCNLPQSIDLLKRSNCKPTVHFLKGQLNSSLFPSRSHDNTFNAMAIWWGESNILNFYLLKQYKDQPGPYFVLPHSDIIKLTCVNSQTNLIATYTRNGCITVWNRSLGCALEVFRPEDALKITMLKFSTVLDGKEVKNRLTFASSNGKLCQVTCGKTGIEQTVRLDDRSSRIFDNDYIRSYIKSPINLITLIWNSGQIVVYNEMSSCALCQLEIFNDEQPNGDSIHAVYMDKYIIIMRYEKETDKIHSRFFLFCVQDSPVLNSFIPSIDNRLRNDEEEKADVLDDYYFHFLRDCSSQESSLHSRVMHSYQEMIKA